MIVKEKIGISAGKIWDILQKSEEVAISKLPNIVGETEAITYQALGWLARENKIEYRTTGRTIYISSIK